MSYKKLKLKPKKKRKPWGDKKILREILSTLDKVERLPEVRAIRCEAILKKPKRRKRRPDEPNVSFFAPKLDNSMPYLRVVAQTPNETQEVIISLTSSEVPRKSLAEVLDL